MKTWKILLFVLLTTLVGACTKNEDGLDGKAMLRICFEEDFLSSKAAADPSDTSNYRLIIRPEKGKPVYDGLWSERPDELVVDAGTYSIRAESRDFSKPMFDAAVYGDFQVFTLNEGEVGTVRLNCSQQNAGVRIIIKDTFIANYEGADLYLRTSEGTLAYTYDESRTAFFNPGKLVLLMNLKGQETILYTRFLAVGEMLTLELSAAERMPLIRPITTMGFRMSVDTSRTWVSDIVAYDGSGSTSGGGDELEITGAVSVSEARAMAGSKSVWVYGYIVGGDLSSSSASFTPPFTSRTNLVLAENQDCTEKNKCLSVQLAKGDIRDALNLVDNVNLLGKKVYLKGNVVDAYYKIPGLQNLSDYRL